MLNERVPGLVADHADRLLLAGTELTIADLGLQGDHAALEETSYGLALFPEHIDMTALTAGRGADSTWSTAGAPAESGRHPGVEYDPAEPLFGQLGEDARQANADRGEAGVVRLVEELSSQILRFLGES
ncbi:MAG TPA: hypothetical protein EYQ31_07735 [Candidatus Handelsmanbacteria bacterium]|nr:hypothetical protein [Candidatus Handelsmanbacteria bacterium]